MADNPGKDLNSFGIPELAQQLRDLTKLTERLIRLTESMHASAARGDGDFNSGLPYPYL
jgi:hypothetical protein